MKDYLRDRDGLVLISKQLTSSIHTEIREAALYTLACAVDKNGMMVFCTFIKMHFYEDANHVDVELFKTGLCSLV